MIKGVIFDMDGTVIDSTALDFEALKKAFEDYNLSFTYEDYISLVGAKGEEIVKSKSTLNDAEVKDLLQKKSNYFREAVLKNSIKGIPGIEDFLKELKSVPLWTALATGSRLEKVDLIMENVMVSQYFDVIVTADDIQAGKPNPEIFLAAAAKLNLLPEECVVFEDASLGIKAAHQAGMMCIAIKTSTPVELLSEADLIIDSYTDPKLDEYFEKIIVKED